jgi:cell wall-associated NlpC family hydrolase
VNDRRATPANARVAAAHLADAAAGLQRVSGTARQVIMPVCDLCRAPGRARDRQLLFGDTVAIYEDRAGWAFVQADKDGYVGYLRADALGPVQTATHVVAAPATHVYAAPDIKSPDLMGLSLGSRLHVRAQTGGFAQTDPGFVPLVHLRVIDQPFDDPVSVADLFLGTPYLWGGNSRAGIDCSGLVQAAMLACGHACPGDSDQQQAALGPSLPQGTPPRRGDLLFWRGHVALMTAPDELIHANAATMAVTREPLTRALERIAAAGGGPVTAHLRPADDTKRKDKT